MKDLCTARRLEINGVVQGVGFRPFLFQLAGRYDLFGEVANTSKGVVLIVEGEFKKIQAFTNDIQTEKPILSSITDIRSEEIPKLGYTSFTIQKSKPCKDRSTLISPDVSICKDCLEELNNPEDRRYEYPFINCTNCGPRFTIIEDIPYDRPKTSMKHFPMCEDCQKEYYNPLDRRFHAQPNACAVCGPHVTLVNSLSENICEENENSIDKAAELLNMGKIIAVKGLGVFHLAVDASNNDAVLTLRKRKVRPDKPFALMAQSVDAIKKFVHVNETEKKLLESFNRPIVLLEKKENNYNLALDIAPNNNYLGIMLPYTPLHYILLKKGPEVLVMTSGNRSDEPLSIDNDEALDAFGHIADYFLIHNRDIYFRADDSIIQINKDKTRFLRRSRGYAPLPIYLGKAYPKVLATGGGLKSTVCLTKNNQAFLSQYIGDLNNYKTFTYYKDSIWHLKKIMDIEPEIIAHDMHPGYMSTDYAKDYVSAQKGIKIHAVQHHHAHAVSCMAENQIDHEVIALTLDGTGFGTDGKIWGGEILTCDYTSFTRQAHLEYIPMPGSETAVLEPWRMAVAYLDKAFGNKMLGLDIALTRDHKKDKLEFLQQMMQKGLNSPLTSSAGRLFDGVASILGIRYKITFESQAAMELEAVSKKDLDCKAYSFSFEESNNKKIFEIKLGLLIKEVVQDITSGEKLSDISTRFHRTFVDMFVKGVLKVRQNTGLNDVVLSGGVFNNNLVFDNILKDLENNDLKVYTHTLVPAGDGGISLGQAIIAGAKEEKLNKG
ncbi:MAG: carbamoyltransferase HypF [Desulfobacteraceae bacterium]|nr:carbamoyltransferase HypF [Desulfobacteraceae bacterium]